jgi:hypothetical protein
VDEAPPYNDVVPVLDPRVLTSKFKSAQIRIKTQKTKRRVAYHQPDVEEQNRFQPTVNKTTRQKPLDNQISR